MGKLIKVAKAVLVAPFFIIFFCGRGIYEAALTIKEEMKGD